MIKDAEIRHNFWPKIGHFGHSGTQNDGHEPIIKSG